jgi:hypothetical protein
MLAFLKSLDPLVIAAFGAVGSAMLAALAYVLKLRFERKRTVRLVLFQLFQLRQHLVLRSLALNELPARLLDAFRSTCQEQGIAFTDSEFTQLCEKAKPAALSAALESEEADIREVRVALNKSLTELAKDSPLLAYRLALSLPEPAREGSDTSDTPQSEDQRIKEIATYFVTTIKHEATRKALESQCDSTKHCIRLAALEVGVFTLLDSEIALRRQNKLQISSTHIQQFVRSAVSGSVLVATGIARHTTQTPDAAVASGA